jgi:hypothetical protein
LHSEWDKQMLRAFHVVAALLMMALSPAALAQKSSGHMDLNDLSSILGARLAIFRVMFSGTDVVCPQQTGLFQIRPDGAVTDIVAIMRNTGPGYHMDPTAASDDFTFRRRLEAESCRIDIDISEQQQRNGEWVPLVAPLARGPEGLLNERARPRKEDDPIARPPSEREAFDRDSGASANAGSLRQGLTGTIKSNVGFLGAKDCFDAIGIFQIDRSGVTLLFPAGLQGELNRFFIERVDVDADHSTLYLSRGSCRFGFTISAAVSREGAWVPLPIEPFKPLKWPASAEKN